MTPAKSVLAAILFATVGLSGPLSQAWSRSSQTYDRSGRGLPARGAFGRYPTRPSLHLHPSHREQHRASQTLFSFSPCPALRLVPRHASKNFPSQPLHSPAVGPSSMTPTTTRATLRKSSHPTPFDAFCFCVCMVPCLALISYLMIPIPTTFDVALPAGHAEHAVRLCAELEHPGQAPEGFSVEAVDVTTGGAGGTPVRLLLRHGEVAARVVLAPLERAPTIPLVYSSPLSWSVPRFSKRKRSSLRPHLLLARNYDVQSQSHSHRNDARSRVVGGMEEILFPDATVFLHAGTACSTSPRIGHWQRARQTAKCCFAVLYYYYPAYLISKS
ncbi:hypothetical protein EDB83DRAFT_401186 [Lactarius deliciosus]|nr:hypothetical protein EDB83DRAFT_401186 [Lactarius deliciosus]